jgi:RimJ/RimL family protein N-acetyltransferase
VLIEFVRKLTRVLIRQRFCVYTLHSELTEKLGSCATGDVCFSFDSDKTLQFLSSFPDEYDLAPRHLLDFHRAVADEELCISAWVGNRLAFYGWVQFKFRTPAQYAKITIPPGDAYIYRCFTHPDFRGRRLFPGALIFTSVYLKQRGTRRVFIDHLPDNLASRAGIVRSGAEFLGGYTLYRFFPFEWICFDSPVGNAFVSEPTCIERRHSATTTTSFSSNEKPRP